MNIFLRMLEVVTGRRVQGEKMGVRYDGRMSADELEALARMNAAAIRPEMEFAAPGEKRNVITTGDFGPDGRLKDAARKWIDELAKAKR